MKTLDFHIPTTRNELIQSIKKLCPNFRRYSGMKKKQLTAIYINVRKKMQAPTTHKPMSKLDELTMKFINGGKWLRKYPDRAKPEHYDKLKMIGENLKQHLDNATASDKKYYSTVVEAAVLFNGTVRMGG